MVHNNRGLNLSLTECQKLYEEYPEFTQIFDILFENTYYFTRENILDDIESNILKWLRERKNVPLIVILGNRKIGSEHYIYYHFKHLLPFHKLSYEDPNIDESNCEFLFLDDWSLSGANMTDSIDSYLIDHDKYEFKKHYDSQHYKVTAIFSIVSEESIDIFNHTVKNYFKCEEKIYYSHVIPRFDNILKQYGIDPDLSQEFYNTFSPDSQMAAYPVQLEYKVANQFGSYPTIYLKCRSPPKKEFMKDTEKYFTLMNYPTNVFKI